MRDTRGAKSRDEVTARLAFAKYGNLAARCFADCLGSLVALALFPETAHLVELGRESIAREHLAVAVDERVAGNLAAKRIDRLVLFVGDAHADVDTDVDRRRVAARNLCTFMYMI